jgi:NAD(P)-dependent dehydrogenase (short-subunit alcohol dehydrogenase family)
VLDGKVALITGAAQGIGKAIAVEMARQGASAVAVADRDAQGAEHTAQLVREQGAEADPITCDVRIRDQIKAMVDRAADRFNGLDVLVNNAGIIETSLTGECSVDTLPEEVWDAVYEVNLRAPWLATKYAAPHLRRSTRGPSVLNAASVAGLIGNRRGPVYCSSKGGVVQLTKVTAVDLAPRVRCNCFCPGTIETPMSQAFIDTAEDPLEFRQKMLGPQLLDRPGTPEEVAKLACFLVSNDAAFINGAAVVIDGGKLAWRGVREQTEPVT